MPPTPRSTRARLAAGALLGSLVVLALAAGAGWGRAADITVTLTPAFGGRVFDLPVDLVPLTADEVLVAEQRGRVLAVRADGSARPVLDIGDRLAEGHEELGLLSIAVDPRFATTGALWAYYTAPSPLRGVVARFTVDARTGVADPASALVVLEVPQPFENHNGGALRFGPDGMLYLGLGDGGDAADPLGSGQDRSTLLGTVIRIDVRDAAPGRPYRVPADNPLVGDPDARPEIWAYGLRNPWRMAFDPTTGTLWAGDVGQYREEEIDVITVGGNYGWSEVEGTRCFRRGCDRSGTVAPVASYTHDDGCAVTGGAVYRGPSAPDLVGRYVFGDLCTGAVFALDADGRRHRVATAPSPLVSFGTDAAGELYVLTFAGPVLRIEQPGGE